MTFFDPDRLLLIAVLGLCALFLSPMLALGYTGDDVFNSFGTGWLIYTHKTLWDGFVNVAGAWLQQEGRFFPVGMIYSLLFWHFFASQPIEKAVQLIAVVVNVATLALFAGALSKSRRVGTLAALLVLVTLEIRAWHDGIVSFFILVPVALEFALLGAYCLVRWLERPDRKRWLAGSLLLCATGFLTYELTYGLALANLYIALRLGADRRTKLLGFGSTAALIAGFVVFDLILRSAAHVTHGVYAIAFNTGSYVRAAVLQAFGAIPLSYAATRPLGPGVQPPLSALIAAPAAVSIACGVLALIVAFAVGTRVLRPRTASIDLLAVGVVYWIVPAAILALSPRWQAELAPGLAYIGVYIEYFGVALVLAGACAALLQRFAFSATAGVFAVALAFALYATAQSNARAAAQLAPFGITRANLERAMKSGLFDLAPEGSTIVLDGSYLFNFDDSPTSPNAKYMLAALTGRRYTAIPDTRLGDGALCAGPRAGDGCAVRPNVFRYHTFVDDAANVWIQLGHVVALEHLSSPAPLTVIDEANVYAAGPVRQHAADAGAAQIRTDRDGAVYAYRDCPAISDEVLATGNPNFAFGPGFYGLESDGNGQFEWMGRHGSIVLTNPASRPRRVDEALRVTALAPESVAWTLGGRRHDLAVGANGAVLALAVDLAPLATATIALDARGGKVHVPGDPRELALHVYAPKPDLRLCGSGHLEGGLP
jgi:hypothetical protein